MKFQNETDSLFNDLNDDDLIQIDDNEVRVQTPISVHGDSKGNLTIEIHIPPRGIKNAHNETRNGGLCEHENEIVSQSLSEMVGKILDHRFGENGSITKKWSSPTVMGPMAKTDVKALMKKGLAIVAGKDKDKFDA